jgi:hypothetical protein
MNPNKLRPDGMSIGVGINMASAPFPDGPAIVVEVHAP